MVVLTSNIQESIYAHTGGPFQFSLTTAFCPHEPSLWHEDFGAMVWTVKLPHKRPITVKCHIKYYVIKLSITTVIGAKMARECQILIHSQELDSAISLITKICFYGCKVVGLTSTDAVETSKFQSFTTYTFPAVRNLPSARMLPVLSNAAPLGWLNRPWADPFVSNVLFWPSCHYDQKLRHNDLHLIWVPSLWFHHYSKWTLLWHVLPLLWHVLQ